MEDIVDLAKKAAVSDRMCSPPAFQEYRYLYGIRPMLLIYSD